MDPEEALEMLDGLRVEAACGSLAVRVEFNCLESPVSAFSVVYEGSASTRIELAGCSKAAARQQVEDLFRGFFERYRR